MNSRERITALIARDNPDRTGFWLGNPDPATWPLLHGYFGTTSEEELRVRLGDDLRWCAPQVHVRAYFHPAGREIFDIERARISHGQDGPLTHVEDIAALDDYEWPRLDYIDLSPTIEQLKTFTDTYRASGFWTPFFHEIINLLGMENYLIKMRTHPELVHAVTDRVCQFFYDANELFFATAGDHCEAFFFGNDFGTQRDLLLSPATFDEFLLPWITQFINLAKRHGKQVMMHSCGSIYRIIPRLIDAGVECLHPLQAQAAQMDAVTLARDFGGRLTFLGGIDAQGILPHGTPNAVAEEVRRVRDILGPYVIISPSHEAILPDVPPVNAQAMAEAARRS